MRVTIGLLLCLIGLLVASPVSAQEISGGGKVGFIVSNLSSAEDFDPTTKSGFAAGGFVSIGINDLFSIQPEVLFVQKGAKLTEDGEDGDEATLKLNYVEVPILAVFTIQTSGNVTPFVYAGPSFGMNTLAQAEFGGEEQDVSDEVKGSDVSIVFGGGGKVGGFTVEARYAAGVSAISEGEADENIRTRAFMVLAGFSFGN